MPVQIRGGGRSVKRGSRGDNDSLMSILATTIRDGNDRYDIAVVTDKNNNAYIRFKINGDAVVFYLSPQVAYEIGKWLTHLALLAEHPGAVSYMWRVALKGRRRGGGAEQGEAGGVAEEERGEEAAAEFEAGEFL